MKLILKLSEEFKKAPWLWGFLAALVAVAIISRFYLLGQVPHGITWDEAAIGYNGYSVITTRRDEWLQRLPVSFQSYGDYKAPLAIYIVGVSTFLFDVTPFAVRLPFALAGVLFIVSFGFLVKELFSYSNNSRILAILAAMLAITSPWHFHYSRVGFESGLALAFITFSLASFMYVVKRYEHHVFDAKGIIFLTLSGLSFVASLYVYHSAKIFVPFLLLYLVLTYRKFLLEKRKHSFVVVLICLAILYPLVMDSVYGHGAERANVLIITQGMDVSTIIFTFISNFAKHFSADFLLWGKVDSLRHGTGSWGVLTPVTILAGLVGILSFFNSKAADAEKRKKITLFAVALIFLGIVPAALSAETVPHTNRALLALPGFLLLAITGVEYVLSLPANARKKLVLRSVVGTVILVEALWFINIWSYYFTAFAKNSAPDFQDGYIETFTLTEEYLKGQNGKPKVDAVLFSSEYGQPYMYALFVKKTSPIYYRGGSLNNYSFTGSISPQELDKPNILLVTTPSMNFPLESATHIVTGSDGKPRFLLFYTSE